LQSCAFRDPKIKKKKCVMASKSLRDRVLPRGACGGKIEMP